MNRQDAENAAHEVGMAATEAITHVIIQQGHIDAGTKVAESYKQAYESTLELLYPVGLANSAGVGCTGIKEEAKVGTAGGSPSNNPQFVFNRPHLQQMQEIWRLRVMYPELKIDLA